MTLVEAALAGLLTTIIWLVDRDRRHLLRRVLIQEELVKSFRKHTARQLRAQRRRMATLEDELAWELARVERLAQRRSLPDDLTGLIPARHVRAAEVRAVEAARRERFGGTPRVVAELLEQPEAPVVTR